MYRFAVVVAVLFAGLAAGLVYGHIQLGREQEAHHKEMNLMEGKYPCCRKKLRTSARPGRASRAGARSLQAEIEKLKKENGEQAEAGKKVEAEAQSSEAKLKETTEGLARMKAAHDEVSAQLAQVLQAARDLESAGYPPVIGNKTSRSS